MSPTKIAALTTAQIAGLQTADIAAMSPEQFAALMPEQTAALSTAAIAVLNAAQLAAFDTEDIAALTATQIPAISIEVIPSLTTTQISALNSHAIQGLTAAQIDTMSDEQLVALDFSGGGGASDNHAPTASNQTLTTSANVATILTLADFGFSDADPRDTLQSVTITSLPATGSLTLDGAAVTRNQEITATDIAADGLVFTAPPSGKVNFSFKVSDGVALSTSTATLTFNIEAALENLIIGTTGNDTLKSDTKVASNDLLSGLAGNDKLSSFAGNDTLDGGTGNDILDGGAGADSMIGGAGNDIYFVDNIDDVVVETGAGGIDIVASSLPSYTLVANVENGRIARPGASDLTGNALNNVLTVSAGNNVIDGGAGIDTVVYNTAMKAVTVSLAITATQITGGSGNDRLIAIENLTGSHFDDTLTGSNGANMLAGNGGNDKLTGGAEIDTFRFDSVLKAGNVDTITDFSHAYDVIELDNAIFTRLKTTGGLDADNFYANTTGIAKDANDFIVYDTDNGNLWYDADGSGGAAAIQFAIISGAPQLDAADFVIM
ncbi:cadherin-like domain-containing protein [Chromatium okenii]|nr:cadherin-like domain-containing protein [Chromatium okenii]